MAAIDEPIFPQAADRGLGWQWPPRDPAFVGRRVEVFRLHGLLDASRRVVVAGPPGIGKRALIGEYGQRFASAYRHQGLTLRFTSLRGLLAQPPAAWDAGLLAVCEERESPGSAGSAPRLAEALPALLRSAPLARLLLAGSSPAWLEAAHEAHFARLDLPPLAVEDGVALLVQKSGRHQVPQEERRAAARLVQALGGVPARIVQVAAQAQANDLAWSECLRRHLI
jgi:hypothetical protein